MNDDRAPRWPPLIPRTRAPWWLRVRDALLTLAAWFVLLWVLRDALLSLAAGVSPEAAARAAAWVEHRLRPLLGVLVPVPPADFWSVLSEYFYAAGALVAWLALWGWLNRKRLQRQPPSPGSPDDASPAALPTPEQFAAAGVRQDAVVWQRSRLLHVQFDGDGRVRQARADDAPPKAG